MDLDAYEQLMVNARHRAGILDADWWGQLVACWWPTDRWVQPTPEVRRWLQSKQDVVLELRPQRIGEIGVRAAYSAFAMLAGAPRATYLGIDVGDEPKYGTEPGALAHGLAVLATFGPRATVVVADSHHLKRLPPLDLLHIDGDHSFEGCTADLELAERSGVHWVLVDDYFTGDIVCAAVDAFAAARGLDVHPINDGYRGSALIQLRVPPAERA